jgi:hypothetical protein
VEASTQEFKSAFGEYVKSTQDFNSRWRDKAKIDAFEIKIRSEPLTHLKGGLLDLFSDNPFLLTSLIRAGLKELHIFCEVEGLTNWRVAIMDTVHALANGFGSKKVGLKVRCGGLEPAVFPSPDNLAFALLACRQAQIPIKFTAGLHHPIRHFDASLQAQMHGFLNVLTAGVLAYARKLDDDQLAGVLADEDPTHFQPGEDGLWWKDHFVPIEQISEARQAAALTFGSCSFDEPRDDLRKLGWLL